MQHMQMPDHFRGLRPHRLLARLAEEPEVGPALLELGRAVVGALDGRSAETIALYVAAKYECPYIWQAHCRIAIGHPTDPRTPDEIARIALGADALAGADRALVRDVDAVLAHEAAARPPLAVAVATCFYALLATLMKDAEPEDDVVAVPGLESPAAVRRRLGERG